MTSSPTVTLRDGKEIPQVGFGIWSVDPAITSDVVASALQTGYRLIDGAHIYQNEQGLGEGVRKSGVPRDEIFITSKIWNNEHGREKARGAMKRSLEVIGVDYLDLMLIHWPLPMQDLYVETWQALIDMRDEGLVRSIGVSNFNQDHLERIIDATGEAPALNQIEINPRLQQPELCAFHDEQNIAVQAWTPLGSGISFEAEPVTAAAARTGKNPAQVILRWHLQSGRLVIPRSVNPERQAQNLDLFDFDLTDSELDAFKALDVGLRTGPDPTVFKLR